MGLEPTNLLTASQALYQLSYAPAGWVRLAGGRPGLGCPLALAARRGWGPGMGPHLGVPRSFGWLRSAGAGIVHRVNVVPWGPDRTC